MPNYSVLNSFVQSLASSKPGAWLFARIAHRLDAIVVWASRGRKTLSGALAGVPTVILTTTGAKSGKPRSLPLLCVRDAQDPAVFALIATNWGQSRYPAWYFNLKAHPHAVCSIDGRTAWYVAHEAEGEEYERFWTFAAGIYKGYPLYKQRITGRQIPIMVMKPSVLRDVIETDLPIFFEHQQDREANRMAAFPARDRAAFMAHWTKILANADSTIKTILYDGRVAGHIVTWDASGEREVGYWIGKEYWGKGIATGALTEFLQLVRARPLFAHVAKHNLGSRRVLEKCGFTLFGEGKFPAVEGEEQIDELILKLGT